MCVISENANTDDFIINGENGFVYDNSDLGLENAITEILSLSEAELLQVIDNGYNFAKNNFSMSLMIDNYEKLYLSLVSCNYLSKN